ncbi:MAG TPA: hypothetical protein VMV07_20365 [Streptosporangiaceae bacterium]|nr:hypothetical protein [Streptosporangiaceae bacterium]
MSYLLLLMEPGHSEQLTHLQRLADELISRGFTARLLDASQPCVKVTNPENSKLTERVLCHPAADGSWCFWWPSQQPIGAAEDLAAVSGKILTVLRSVEGTS